MKTIIFAILIFALPCGVFAQEKPNEGIEKLYRPVESDDLMAILASESGRGSRFGSRSGLNIDGSNGCPDEIIIGGVNQDTDVFGGVDIDFAFDGDINIICE